MDAPREILVDTADALESCSTELAKSPVIGLDTEFVGEHSYHPELCLIQIATETALYLVDPFAFDDLKPLWDLICDPNRTVVVHAGREEIRLCHLGCGRSPDKLIDLQIAAGLVGYAYPLGHGPLIHNVLGKKIKKGETLTEWRTRPLAPAQIRYAFDDVRYLLPVWVKLGTPPRPSSAATSGPRRSSASFATRQRPRRRATTRSASAGESSVASVRSIAGNWR